VLTQATAAAVPSQATPASIAAAAQSYVGDVWNMNGCWVLASDIAAKAGTSLPATSPLVGITGISNGEWIVAYDGTLTPNANWANSVTTGEMVSFITASGTGHITTVVSGSGAADRQHHLPLSERPGRQQRQ